MRVFSFILILTFFILNDLRGLSWSSVDHSFRATSRLRIGVPVAVAAEDFICPMHPFIHGKAGDHCPICGMALVAAHDHTQTAPSGDNTGSLHVDATYQQALGVKTAPVQMQEFGKEIHAFGAITPNTRLETVVAVRTGGWISDLKTSAVGDTVKKGDLLFTFYSQELAAAESDYVLGNRGNAGERLRLYGMDDKAIAEVKQKGRYLEQTPFYAPVDGTVTALNVRKGSYVDTTDNRNTLILTLQDFSQVWVEAHVPIKDLQFLSVGTPATITIDETGQTLKAVTDYIYPMTDMESRKGMVRLLLDNTDGKLKTGTLAHVMFEAGEQSRLAVPADAVLYGKDGGHVIEALGNGYFRQVTVKTGITANGMTEIVSGLTAGQSVVTSGQFMIDAESSLQGGMASMAGMDMKGMPMPAQNSPTPAQKDMGGMNMNGMDMKGMDMKGMDMGPGHGQ